MNDKQFINLLVQALRLMKLPLYQLREEKPEWTKERHAAECAAERRKLNRLFPGNELDLENKKILIRHYQRIWDREQYPFGVPRNMIKLSQEVGKGRKLMDFLYGKKKIQRVVS